MNFTPSLIQMVDLGERMQLLDDYITTHATQSHVMSLMNQDESHVMSLMNQLMNQDENSKAILLWQFISITH